MANENDQCWTFGQVSEIGGVLPFPVDVTTRVFFKRNKIHSERTQMMQGCKYGKILHKLNNFGASKWQLKQRCCKLKSDASPKHFHLRNDKGDLKGFRTNFETLFYNLTPVRERARKERKSACTLLKNDETSLARAITTMFSSKTVNDLTESIIYFHE